MSAERHFTLGELTEVHDAMKQLVAERKTLAGHYEVVITERVPYGNWRRVMWCTVCQMRQEFPPFGPSPKFVHKEDCLVEKVMKEA